MKTAATLSSTGTPSIFIHATEALHGDMGVINTKDVIIIYSNSGETEEIIKLVEEKGYSETGRMFGVSDNAVRKWIKFGKQYEINDSKKE